MYCYTCICTWWWSCMPSVCLLFRSFTPLPVQHNSIVCGEWERPSWCRTDIVGSRCWYEHSKVWCKWWDVYLMICFNSNYHMCGYSQVLVQLDHNTVQWHWSRIKSVWSPGALIGKLYNVSSAHATWFGIISVKRDLMHVFSRFQFCLTF